MTKQKIDPTIERLFSTLAEQLDQADLSPDQRRRFAETLIEWGEELQNDHPDPPPDP